MDNIEELQKKQIELSNEASRLYRESEVIKNKILALTNYKTKEYIGKYLKYYHNDYFNYLYVTSAEPNCCDDSWYLTGNGFTTYLNSDTGYRIFRTDSNHLDLNDLDEHYYTVEEITKEQFYSDRNQYISEVMNEYYEIL